MVVLFTEKKYKPTNQLTTKKKPQTNNPPKPKQNFKKNTHKPPPKKTSTCNTISTFRNSNKFFLLAMT